MAIERKDYKTKMTVEDFEALASNFLGRHYGFMEANGMKLFYTARVDKNFIEAMSRGGLNLDNLDPIPFDVMLFALVLNGQLSAGDFFIYH